MRRAAPALQSLAVLASVLLLATALAGCSPAGPTWVDSGSSYATSDLASLYAKADISKLVSEPTSSAEKLRHQALTGLRARGGSAASAAELITRTLPSTTRGVPVYVEKATLNGQPALLMIEATGPVSGKLSTKRLWALSESGAVLFVGTR